MTEQQTIQQDSKQEELPAKHDDAMKHIAQAKALLNKKIMDDQPVEESPF